LVKGFKDKNGKFRPTGNEANSALKKSDLEHLELLKSGRISGVVDPQREDMIKELEKQLKEEKASLSSKVTGREQDKQDFITMLSNKGFKLKQTFESDPDEPDEDPIEFNTIEVTEKQTLDAVNGKRSALEINDLITGTTEDERLRNDIDVSNNLLKLETEGKIKIENGVWKKVI